MTWTAPESTRTRPAGAAAERPALQGWLDYHRQTLLAKCAGLTAEQLKRASAEPSNLTLLGLVRHMALVERWWFRRQAAGLDVGDLYVSDERPDADFDDVADADPEAEWLTFADEVRLADEAVAGLPLEHTFRSRRGNELDLRWVYLHMIEEYARHNGHADLLRERIDGATGM
jgi:hypothetical protein